MKKGLSQGGIEADVVGTAGDAGHVLATMQYSAVALDLGLPDSRGLGLAIVARVAAAHGGSISVENRPDGAAIFTLRLRPV